MLTNRKLGIVVLNYRTYQDAIICVDDLLAQDYENIEIIVVDNASPNDSYQILLQKYAETPRVTVLATSHNLGFARGNNVGIRYARQKFACNFVFVLNSDTEIKDTGFCRRILEEYQEGCGVLNPAVKVPSGEWQWIAGGFSLNLVKSTIKAFLGYFWVAFKESLHLNIVLSKKTEIEESAEKKRDSHYIIQGCAYILTPDFFKYYMQIFPGTFLYDEELALAWYLKKAGLYTYTTKNSWLLHKGGGSTGGPLKPLRMLRLELQSFFHILPMTFLSQEKIRRKYSKEEV